MQAAAPVRLSSLRAFVEELEGRGAIGVDDIAFDHDKGVLCFEACDIDGRLRQISIQVTARDARRLAEVCECDNIAVDVHCRHDQAVRFTIYLRSRRTTATWVDGLVAAIQPSRALLEAVAAKSRLADLGKQASALVHELRQPLFTIGVANENIRLLLERDATLSTQLHGAIERVAEQVERAQSIISRSLAYATGHCTAAIDWVRPGDAALNAARFLEPLLTSANIQLEPEVDSAVPEVPLGQVELEQVFVNVLRNAVDSIVIRRTSGWLGIGKITLRVVVQRGWIRCVVTDNGAGLTQNAGERAFQPFFTTKGSQGTGLGLHVSRQILSRAEGVIRIVPGAREGAKVEILLPLRERDGSDVEPA